MGVDYEAQSIIGVRILKPRIILKVRGCHHIESKGNYCSECGQPMYKSEEGYHPIVAALNKENSSPPTKLL